MRITAAIVLVLAGSALLTAFAGASGPTETSLVDTTRWAFSLDTEGLADKVARTGRLEIPLRPSESVTLLLQERELFLPGEKKAVGYDETGNVIYERPIFARFFFGSVENSDARVSLTIAPEGLYGGIEGDDRWVSLQPISWNEFSVTQEVVIGSRAVPRTDILSSLGSNDASLMSNEYLNVKPYAEPAYRSYASDYLNRISSAFAYSWATQMWSNEAMITIFLYSVHDLASNYPSQTVCGGGYDMGLYNFRQNWVQSHMIGGVNAYVLFHASDSQASRAGCAYRNCEGTPSGCLSSYVWPYTARSEATAAILAKDHCTSITCDTYDPDTVRHLAIAVHSELAHLAGEPEHPDDGGCFYNTYNLMASGHSYECLDFWFTSQSETRIRNYAHPRL